MAIVLADTIDMRKGGGGFGIVDKTNRYYKRDKGVPGWGDRVNWANYGGPEYALTLAGPNAIAVLGTGSSPTTSPTPANSILLVQQTGLSVGMGLPLRLWNTAGSNEVTWYHSGTNDVIKTDDGAQIAGSVNVGPTITATGAGDGYLAGGLRVGTGTASLLTANGRVTAGEHLVLGVNGGQVRGLAAAGVGQYLVVLGTTADTTDGSEHFAITAAGSLEWGPGGAAARDAALVRTGVNAMSMTAQTTVVSATAPPLLVNQNPPAATLAGLVALQRGSTTYGALGLDTLNQLTILNATPAAVARVELTHFLSMLPAVRANAGPSSAASGALHRCPMTGADYDTDTMLDVPNSRVKATRAGKYRISAIANIGAAAAGALRQAGLRVNGGTYIAQVTDARAAGAFGTSALDYSVTTSYLLAAGDYVDVIVYQDSGANRTVTAHLEMEYIGL